MENIRGEIRLPETVAPFGVGAIADISENSVIFPDTTWWPEFSYQEVFCERIQRRLPFGKLVQAPINPNGTKELSKKYLTAKRFPEFRFCENCRSLSRATLSSRGKYTNSCECGGYMQPVRFIVVCTAGSHLQEVPWNTWAHTVKEGDQSPKAAACKSTSSLKFLSQSGKGEGLGQLRVLCTSCGSSRSLSGITSPDALQQLGIECDGKQPWENRAGGGKCSASPRVVLRGASGNYIQEVITALDIPEETPISQKRHDAVIEHQFFDHAKENEGAMREYFVSAIASELELDEQTVERIVETADDKQGLPASQEAVFDLKIGEWAAFQNKFSGADGEESRDFQVEVTDLQTGFPDQLKQLISGVGQVHRLREVRTLIGYRRYHVASALQPVSRASKARLYPSLESFGEGIFIMFDSTKLQTWESQPAVSKRAGKIQVQASNSNHLRVPFEQIEPRFIALHTFAHLLIRKLSFQSGYPTAAIRERIYASTQGNDPMAGVLVYTTSGDTQGTFGGLVRLGEPELLGQVIFDALEDARICSNDPVCFEQYSATSSNLNLASCHACSLVAEPSCETGNSILDRQLVIGDNGVGLFAEVMDSMSS